MARFIYSKIQTDKLLHIIHRLCEMKDNREDLVPPDNFIQIATIQLKSDQTFKAHKHRWNHYEGSKIAQESWIVVRGRVEAVLYDVDNSILEKVILWPGDLSITLEGGHNYMACPDGALVYEVKTGPYHGQELDKEFI
jgi:hypothetical protein